MEYLENVKILPIFAVKNTAEAEKLFNFNKKSLGVDYDFEFLKKSSHIFCTFKNDELISEIYYCSDTQLEAEIVEKFDIKKGGGGPMLFMNGFSKRKVFRENLFTIKKTAAFYRNEIFACTNKKTAMFLLLKAGFERVKEKADSRFRLFRLKNKY